MRSVSGAERRQASSGAAPISRSSARKIGPLTRLKYGAFSEILSPVTHSEIDREDRAQQRRDHDHQEEDVLRQEGGLAGEHGVKLVLALQQRQPPDQQRQEAEHGERR